MGVLGFLRLLRIGVEDPYNRLLSMPTGDNLAVSANVSITTGGGNISLRAGDKYNFDTMDASGEMPGISAFRRENDQIYRTYSTYARGLDLLNGAYHLLDITSKGRDEDPEHPMSWVRRHDKY